MDKVVGTVVTSVVVTVWAAFPMTRNDAKSPTTVTTAIAVRAVTRPCLEFTDSSLIILDPFEVATGIPEYYPLSEKIPKLI